MIEPHVRIEGFDAHSWNALIALFAPDPSDAPTGTLVCVVDEAGAVLASLHTRLGRLTGIDRADDLASLCLEHGARRGLRLQRGALEELADRMTRAYADDDDYPTQLLEAARIARRLEHMGHLVRWPKPRIPRPLPGPEVVEAALDTLLPRHRALLLTVYDGDFPSTAVAIARGPRGIDRILGPAEMDLARLASPAALRGEAARLRAHVARHVEPVHVGIFADARELHSLLRDRTPGAWLRAAAEGRLLIEPLPGLAMAGLALDGARAVAHASAELLGGSGLGSVLGTIGRYLTHHAGPSPSLEAILGWNPLEALADLLERDLPFEVKEPKGP